MTAPTHYCTNIQADEQGAWRCTECGAYEDEVVDYPDEDEESKTCPHCNGTGLDMTGLEECDCCDGMGYKWWL